MSETTFSFPLWLILFMIAGFILFLLKIASGGKSHDPESKRFISLRLFLIITFALLVVAGLVHFYEWVQP